LLSKDNVSSGNAIKYAEDLYDKHQRTHRLKDTLPKAWHKIITDPDDLLVELLIETTEKMSGFRPEMGDVEKFLSTIRHNSILKPEALTPITSPKPVSVSQPTSSTDDYLNRKVQNFVLLGKTYNPRNWKELLVTVSEEMYRRHSNEFDRCLSLRGTKMIYFSLRSSELKLPVQIADSRYFVETKFSSNSIVKHSRELMALFGYKGSDLIVTAV
jgi:hypothetical protein